MVLGGEHSVESYKDFGRPEMKKIEGLFLKPLRTMRKNCASHVLCHIEKSPGGLAEPRLIREMADLPSNHAERSNQRQPYFRLSDRRKST